MAVEYKIKTYTTNWIFCWHGNSLERCVRMVCSCLS